MQFVFVELPPFARQRRCYLGDGQFLVLQNLLLLNPELGVLVQGTGGLRKLRFPDAKGQKGKRGGIRLIYYWWKPGQQIWLFTIYRKGEIRDLTAREKSTLRELLRRELSYRRKKL